MRMISKALSTIGQLLVVVTALAFSNAAMGQTTANVYANEDAFVFSLTDGSVNNAYNAAYDTTGDPLDGEWLGLGASNSSALGGRVRSYIQFTLPITPITAGTLNLYQANTIVAAGTMKAYALSAWAGPFNDITPGSVSSPLPAVGTEASINNNTAETSLFQIGGSKSVTAGTTGWYQLSLTSSEITTLNQNLGATITMALHFKLTSGATVDNTEPIFEDYNGTLESAAALASPGNATDLIDITSQGLAGTHGANQVGLLGPNGTDSEYFSFTFAAIPEPTSLALLALGGLLVWSRRRSA
jgi:hypothetical protein